MSKKPKTRVTYIIDESGSMGGTQQQTIQGFNEHLQEMKKNSDKQEILVSLVLFSGPENIFSLLDNVPVEEVEELTVKDYNPNGSTAMRDAVAWSILKMHNIEEEDEDCAYLFQIISDGYTNSDSKYDAKRLKSLIDECQATGKWTFSYMGCSEEYVNVIAVETGISAANVAAWDNSSGGTALGGMRAASARNSFYFAGRSEGVTSSLNYMSDSKMSADFTQEVADIHSGTSVDATKVTSTINTMVADAINIDSDTVSNYTRNKVKWGDDVQIDNENA